MRNVFTLFFMLIAVASCAQKQYGIVKTYSYYKEFMPGTVPVDLQGNEISRPLDTTFLAFLETKGNAPVWQRAWVNNKTYNVLVTKMANNHRVGFLNDSDDAVKLKVSAANKLVQINLEQRDQKIAPPASYRSKLKNNSILLEGIYNNKKVYWLLTKPVHLRADEHP
jgi:hypothetical protein